MSNLLSDWQTIVALIIVAASILVVIVKAVRLGDSLGGGAGHCASGGCTTCPASAQNQRAPKQVELIELD